MKTFSTLLILLALAAGLRAQTFTSLQSFNGIDGANPRYVALVQGRDGGLYGTTAAGGANDAGAVIRIKSGTGIRTLYSFCAQSNCADGAYPFGGLVLGNDGNLYGTTFQGGANNGGTVFKVTPKGALTTLYSFCAGPNCADGEYPQARLVQGIDGNFYGTTYWAGANANNSLYDDGGGTVFRITPAGQLTTLHSFCSQVNCTDGDSSLGGLVQGSDGNFYGTTVNGGPPSFWCDGGCGTIFKMTPQGRITTLYDFCSQDICLDGDFPYGGLLQSSDGNLYGTTLGGGAYGVYGTAFRLTPSGEFTTLHSFCNAAGCPDGASPSAGIVQATDGNLYGASGLYSQQICNGATGGNCGTIFSLGSSGSFTTLFSFCAPDDKQEPEGFQCPTGAGPLGGLMQDTDGYFYGITTYGGRFGGSFGDGTVFRFSTGLGPFVSLVQAAGKVGASGGVLGQGFTGTTNVELNGMPVEFTVISDTYIRATVPGGATSGYVTVTTPSGVLTSNRPFRVIP